MAALFPQSNTLLQLNAMFAEVVNAMSVYNSYMEGSYEQISANTTKYYPLLWAQINPMTINETYTTYNFRLYSMDLVFEDRRNLLSVQSDMLAYLHHVLYAVRDNYGLVIEWNSIQATPFDNAEGWNDEVAGYYIDVKIQIPWSLGSCDIPLRQAFDTFRWIDYDGSYFVDYDGSYFDYQKPL